MPQEEDRTKAAGGRRDLTPPDPSYFDEAVREAEFGEANRPENLEDPRKASGNDRQTMLDHPEPTPEEASLQADNRPMRYQDDFVETPEGLARLDTLGRLRPLVPQQPGENVPSEATGHRDERATNESGELRADPSGEEDEDHPGRAA